MQADVTFNAEADYTSFYDGSAPPTLRPSVTYPVFPVVVPRVSPPVWDSPWTGN
jgi:hypothetical protein